MATVSPVFSTVAAPGGDVSRVAWAAMATGDTINALAVSAQAAVVGSVQFTGSFGSATVKLQVSNDGTNFVDMKDLANTAISATAAGYFEFTTAGVYLRPAISGGTGDAVTATLALRG